MAATMGPVTSLVVLVVVAWVALVAGIFRRAARARRREEERRLALTSQSLQAALLALRLQAPHPIGVSDYGVPGAGEPTKAPASEARMVCTYRRADGWPEAMCPVCLSDMEDGEAVRVLPPCMHYFHEACVGEWLRGNNTCPLCRAPPAAEGGHAAAV